MTVCPEVGCCAFVKIATGATLVTTQQINQKLPKVAAFPDLKCTAASGVSAPGRRDWERYEPHPVDLQRRSQCSVAAPPENVAELDGLPRSGLLCVCENCYRSDPGHYTADSYIITFHGRGWCHTPEKRVTING